MLRVSDGPSLTSSKTLTDGRRSITILFTPVQLTKYKNFMARFVQLVLLLLAAILSLSNGQRRLIGGNDDCGATRVRKSWENTSANDIETYLKAVESAIRNNQFQDFVKLHVDKQSSDEAHESCGFMLWHRRYLLAFENMLRSQGPEFSCVTVPFWDTMTQYVRMADGKCGNLQDCASITNALGSGPGIEITRTFQNIRVSGKCYNGRPLEELCDDNGECGCLPRNDVRARSLPQGSSFVSLFNIISQSKSYADFTKAIQTGVHGEIHNAVGGIMSTFAASYDPLFFSWHGSVDMLMSVYHECHVPNPLLGEARFTSAFAFNQVKECRASTLMSANSEIYMKINGQDARDHPTLGKYFQDVGTEYGDFADARSMGDYSYQYEIPASFHRMLSDVNMCKTAASTTLFSSQSEESAQGSTFWQWYESTQKHLKLRFPENPIEVNNQLEFLDCIGYNEKFGVRNYSNAFISEFLNGKEVTPRCQTILNKLEANVSLVDFKEQSVKWGQQALPSKGTTTSDVHVPNIEKKLKQTSDAVATPISFLSAILIALLLLAA